VAEAIFSSVHGVRILFYVLRISVIQEILPLYNLKKNVTIM